MLPAEVRRSIFTILDEHFVSQSRDGSWPRWARPFFMMFWG